MLMPSTITALRTRRYDSTWYIPGTIHGVENDPLDGGRRYSIQLPIVSNFSASVVHFNSADYTTSADHPITLNSGVRHTIRKALRDRQAPLPDSKEEEIHGVLRALNLNQDWIDVVTEKEGKSLRIVGTGEEVDDRIGPMVNQPVLVRVARVGEKRNFIDIELDD